MKVDEFLDDFIKIAKKVNKNKEEEIDLSEYSIVTKSKEKNASYKLSTETEKWNQEILKRLYETHDWLDPDNYYLKWKSDFDGEKGFGIGVIVLKKEDKTISIPVVIVKHKLQPLDMFYHLEEEKMYPLTKNTVEQAFHNTGIAKKMVDKRKRNRSPINDVFPPRLGKYVFASANVDITDVDMADFHARIKDKEVLASIKDNNNFKKVANEILNKQTMEEGKVFNPITKISSVLVSPENKKGYRLDWVEDGEYMNKTASYLDVLGFIKEAFDYDKEYIDEKLKEVDDGNKTAIYNNNVKNKALNEGDLNESLKVGPIRESKRITAKTKFGEDVVGFVIPKVYSLHTGKITEDKLLVDDDRNIITYDSKIVGRPNPGKKNLKEITAREIIQFPTRDSIISFIWWSRKYNDFVGLQPGKILDYEEVESTGKLFTIMTTFGSMQKVMKAKNIIQPDFSKNNKYNAILIPDNSSLVLLNDEPKELIKNSREFKKQITKNANVIQADYSNSTNEYQLKGDEFEKIASPRKSLVKLISEGIPYENANKLLKEAKVKGSKLYATKKLEKEASIDKEAELENVVNELREIKKDYDLVKIAADTRDLETINKILSLNFVNKKNLNYFYRMLPEFQKTVNQLAELLLAARISNVGISESAIKDAMEAIQTLIEKMEGFQTDR